MSAAAGVRGKLYVCSHADCTATFSKECRLMEHLYRHDGLMPFVCDHDGCGKGFTRKFHLSRHRLTHTGEKPYRCVHEGCSECFTTNGNLKKHMKRKHENESNFYKCEFDSCGKTFKKHQRLKTHQYEHTKELPFACSHTGCEQKFLQAMQLKRHKTTHLGYACKTEGCDFIAKTWSEMRSHTARQHPGCHVCNKCGRKFKRRAFLNEHELTHAESREVFACPRPSCERTYTTAFNLRSHLLSFHENLRPHSCPHPGCGRTFAMKQSLDRHGVVHDPEKKKLKKKRVLPRRTLASRLSGVRHSAVASETTATVTEACDGEFPDILFGKASIGSPPLSHSPEANGFRPGSRDPAEDQHGKRNEAPQSPPDAQCTPTLDSGSAVVGTAKGNGMALTSEIHTATAAYVLQRSSVINIRGKDQRGGVIPINCKDYVNRPRISPIIDQNNNEASI